MSKNIHLVLDDRKTIQRMLDGMKSFKAMSAMDVQSVLSAALKNEFISPLIRKKQSPHHIYVTNADFIMISERTIYRLIDARIISAMNMGLPRKVRYSRESLGNKCPYNMFAFLYGHKIPDPRLPK